MNTGLFIKKRPTWIQPERPLVLAMTIALGTTMRGSKSRICIGEMWTCFGNRSRYGAARPMLGYGIVPINNDACEAILELRKRAGAVGEPEDKHFLFPACKNGNIDPERGQKSWRTAWRRLTKAADIKRLRFHDCRHHAITELAESQASDGTIQALAEHLSTRMLERYSQVRQEATRDAVNLLSAKHPSKSAQTGYDTN